MNAPQPRPLEQVFAQFLALQQSMRKARDLDALGYAMVNEPQPLFGYRHAALLIAGRVRNLTGISVIDPHAPFVAFVERAARQGAANDKTPQARLINPSELDPQTQADWQALSAGAVVWVPLCAPDGQPFGGLWLAREQPWSEPELALLSQLGECQAHAWWALQPRHPWRLRWPRKRLLWIAAALLLLLALPIRQSVLAPAEVVPLDGQVIAAPLDGVIAEFMVKPNQPVEAGDLLVRFDNTSLRAQADVAERSLQVAEAELRASTQRAFSDSDASARIDLLAARVDQKRAERDHARQLLQRSEVRAERAGIAVFADAQRWTGRPVQTGERLMEIADPERAQLRIDLAVGDVLAFAPDAEVALFLDSDPLTRRSASLVSQAYEAQPLAGGQLAYRFDAAFVEQPPRIGLRGTAKLYGPRGPLALYLLRRPIAALRQTVGI
ncbi:MAG: HlyD family efflux transporter periplasmic adaptor subunit [Halopseudomonas sp.]|uniref:efflux RND transporter periplasmic adaptor subunit n=1 Tax=Halopseudomonas sp. TaxID=2901191 RepID=UPI0030021234